MSELPHHILPEAVDRALARERDQRDVAGLAAAVRVVLDDPAGAQRRAVAARERLTSDFDWHTVAGETAQVYLAAKRAERQPQPRRPIIEQALPGRG